MKEYAIIFEKGPNGWSAYAPDLPGLGAAGDTLEEVEQLIQDGVRLHIEVLKETGNPVPEPTTRVAMAKIAA
jgi:predicted RNase H-like HicB family nuclease